MKITVEVYVPDGNKCSFFSCDFHNANNHCKLFHCDLKKTTTYEAKKCPDCLVVCQKAMECEPKPLPTRDFLVSCGSSGTVVLDGTGRIDELQ